MNEFSYATTPAKNYTLFKPSRETDDAILCLSTSIWCYTYISVLYRIHSSGAVWKNEHSRLLTGV